MRTPAIPLGCVLLAFLTGCSDSYSTTPPPQPTEEVAEPEGIESRLDASEIPKTPEALKDELVRRFDEDNYGAYRDLCYWEGVSEDVRQKNMKVFMIGHSKSHITTARIEPCSPDQFDGHFSGLIDPPNNLGEVPNLTPTHALYYETVSGDGSMKTRGDLPVGGKDGGYYICVGVAPQ